MWELGKLDHKFLEKKKNFRNTKMKNPTESVLKERTSLKMVNYLGVKSNQKLVWFIILKRPL